VRSFPESGEFDASVHPVLVSASEGVLPRWARATKARVDHMTRVSALMASWARTREEPAVELTRWKAAGFLHDALRDESHDVLRSMVDPPLRDLPGKILHGPGAASMLRAEGVQDEELLDAIRYHTLGSASFESLGWALYAADFLEPGRVMREDWRAELRERAPGDLEAVVKEILVARIGYQLEKGRPLHPETLGFWNRLSEGQPWAGASEY